MFIHCGQVMKSTEVTFNSWVDNKWSMPPRSFYPATKKSKIISFAAKQIELEVILLGQFSLTQKTTYEMLSLICKFQILYIYIKSHKHTYSHTSCTGHRHIDEKRRRESDRRKISGRGEREREKAESIADFQDQSIYTLQSSYHDKSPTMFNAYVTSHCLKYTATMKCVRATRKITDKYKMTKFIISVKLYDSSTNKYPS